ncbi:hypothetical protein ACQJBY_030764 [Aegilops geniculata]
MSRSGGTNGPGEWPFLVGVPAATAMRKIRHDRPDVTVEVIPDGTPVPGEYNPKRVRVFYDSQEPDAPVAKIPVIG